MRIILYGPQGSGKTTQTKLLAQKYGLLAISAGEVSRQIASEDTDEGRMVRALVNSGQLTPDDILFKRLKLLFESPSAHNGFVLDGFPRNEEQFIQIEGYFREKGWRLDKVIVIHLPEEESLRRIASRIQLEGRADDTPEAIKTRLRIFEEQTKPIIDRYRQLGIVADIDGSGTIEEVFNLIDAALRS